MEISNERNNEGIMDKDYMQAASRLWLFRANNPVRDGALIDADPRGCKWHEWDVYGDDTVFAGQYRGETIKNYCFVCHYADGVCGSCPVDWTIFVNGDWECDNDDSPVSRWSWSLARGNKVNAQAWAYQMYLLIESALRKRGN